VRSLPPQDNEGARASVGLLGKLLTQFGVMELRSAMMIDRDAAPENVVEIARRMKENVGPEFLFTDLSAD